MPDSAEVAEIKQSIEQAGARIEQAIKQAMDDFEPLGRGFKAKLLAALDRISQGLEAVAAAIARGDRGGPPAPGAGVGE